MTITELSCPKCRGTLDDKANDRVAAWTCHDCDGLWIHLEGHEQEIGPLKEFWAALEKFGSETALDCPGCDGVQLIEVKFGGCRLDGCPKCQGIFFDSGELDRIRKHLAGGGTASSFVKDAAFVGGEVVIEVFGWVVIAALELVS